MDFDGNANKYSQYGKYYEDLSKNLNIPILGIQPKGKKSKYERALITPKFIAAQFTRQQSYQLLTNIQRNSELCNKIYGFWDDYVK